MRTIVIVGLDKEVIELAESLPGVQILGLIDCQSEIDTLGHPYLGADDSWAPVHVAHPEAKVVLALDVPALKERLVKVYGIDSLASLVSPSATVSLRASMGPGHIVQGGCRIHACASLGVACKINFDAVIHHDCVIGNYCSLAPGSRLLGKVRLGDRVFIGAGAIVLPKVCIGHDSVIGAGAVVVKDVPDGATVVGVPARPIVK